MRYIEEKPFQDRHGKQVVLPREARLHNGSMTMEPTLGEWLWILLDAYDPTPELRLSTSEIKNQLWPALDVLEKGPNTRGFYVFEDQPFETMKRIATFYGERAQGLRAAVHAPVVESALNDAPKGNDPTALEPLTSSE